MFAGAIKFNQPLNDWRVDNVLNMARMFDRASSFNQPLSGWRVDKVLDMATMFKEASAFDQDLGWSLCNVNYGDAGFSGMFEGTQCASTSCGVVQVNSCHIVNAATPARCPKGLVALVLALILSV